MQNIYELYETDAALEKKGIGLKFGPALFIARRAGGANKEFEVKFNEKTRHLTTKLQVQSLPEDESERILKEVYAEAVIVGWEGVTDRTGNTLEFNVKNFVQVMTDLPTLWTALRQAASDHSNFLLSLTKKDGETLGNA